MTRLVPRAGMIILDPVTKKRLPPEGEEVELNSYWIRRMSDGDVAEPRRPKKPRPNKGTEG